MIECSSCHTLSPDSEKICLACGAKLRSASTSLPTGAMRCPSGHPIDPSWKTCPYCERAAKGAAPPGAHPTRLEGADPRDSSSAIAARHIQAEVSNSLAPPARRSTRLEEPASASKGRRTVLQENSGVPPEAQGDGSPAPSTPGGGAGPRVRLVAVLAAPQLGQGGSVFPIRAGKTTLGADPRSDVPIAGDATVSNEHAAILYRDGIFHIVDRLSANGTSVNGHEVPANGTVKLHDRDLIRLGNSLFVLLMIDSTSIQTPAQAGS